MTLAFRADSFHRFYDNQGRDYPSVAEQSIAMDLAERLKAAWEIRQTQWPNDSKATTSDLAKALLAFDRGHVLKDRNDPAGHRKLGNKITKYFNQGHGYKTALPQLLIDFMEVPPAFLSISSQKSLPAWSFQENGGNVNNSRGVSLTYTRPPRFAGGGAGVFTVDSSEIEIKEDSSSPLTIEVEIKDASLLPNVRPGEIVVFRRAEYPRMDRTLLVRSRTDATKHAIRVYEPMGKDGKGAFVDLRNGEDNPPLPESEWVVIGMATGKLNEDGVLL